MKKLLFFAIYVIAFSGSAQELGQKKKNAASVGTIFTEDYTSIANLSNYTVVKPSGNVSFAITSGSLRMITSPTVGGIGNYLQFNNYLGVPGQGTALENWTLEVLYTYQSNASDGNSIISIGTKSITAGSNYDFLALLQPFSGGAGVQTLNMYINGSQVGSTATGILGVTSGQTIRLRLIKAGNVMTTTAFNTSTSAGSLTNSYTYNLVPTAPLAPNVSQFVLMNQAGSNYVSSMAYSSPDSINSNIIFASNSIAQWYAASSVSNAYPHKLMAGSLKHSAICSGQGMRVSDGLLITAEIKMMKPRWVWYNLISNSIGGGVSSATWQADYVNFVSQMRSAGIGLILCSPEARNDFDMTPAQTYVNTYSNDWKVDLFAATKQSGNTNLDATYEYTDHIHLVNAGMTQVAATGKTTAPHIFY